MNEATDETLTMAPWPRSRMALPAAWDRTRTARQSTSKLASSSVDVVAQERALEGVAGVVDEQVDGAGPVGEPLGDLAGVGAVGQVGHEDLGGDAVLRLELVGDVLQPGAVAGDEHHVVPALREEVGEGQCRCRPWRR